MLEIRNLTKIYHSKTGSSVRALDNVSVTFPETGMVFILGKSGSGKSTLLNMIGGLDGCDEGEFIIKGRSSRSFAGSDFDSYRNTFIGFIFQEYNILEEFTVGANIALALELQGKRATSEQINQILEEVDMLSFASRKPNELSGGQKQRIAIARALVKDPEIIMADEPTGALDSNTGKQIFDTLKQLSKRKLVIVVSHDRDFAERYGDRIIEMKDGRIDSDVSKHEVESEKLSGGLLKITGNLLRVKKGYQLTEEDVSRINAYLREQSEDVIISGDGRINEGVRSAAGIDEDGRSSTFAATEEKDVVVKKYEKDKIRFIRSRLPFKNALKMGANSLGYKKFRLVFTVFLSLIAFTLFGFADTLGAYQKVPATVDSILDSHIQNATLTANVRHTYEYPDGDTSYHYQTDGIGEADIAYLKEKTGLTFLPVFNGNTGGGSNRFSLSSQMMNTSSLKDAYEGSLYGFAAPNEAFFAESGYTVYGTLPSEEGEIAISEFLYRQFNLTGFRNSEKNESVAAGSLTMAADGSESSIIGKHITVNMHGFDYTYKITAVVDTGFDYQRYASFIPADSNTVGGSSAMGQEQGILDMVLQMELENTLRYGTHTVGFVTEKALSSMSANMYMFSFRSSIGTMMQWNAMLTDGNYNRHFSYVATLSELPTGMTVTYFDGQARQTLGVGEMLVSEAVLRDNFDLSEDIGPKISEFLARNGAQSIWDLSNEQVAGMMSELFGITVSEQMLSVDGVIRNELHVDSDGCLVVSPDRFFNILLRQSVYETVIVGQKYLESDFFDKVIVRHYGYDDKESFDRLSKEEKENISYYAYINYCYNTMYDQKTAAGDIDYSALTAASEAAFEKVTGKQMSAYYAEALSEFYISVSSYQSGGETKKDYRDYRIVGTFSDPNGNRTDLLVSDAFYALYESYRIENGLSKETVAPHESGLYAYAVAPMPRDTEVIRALVEMSYDEEIGVRYELQNAVMDTLDSFNEFIEMGAQIFLYIGIGFAVFSALMLTNFIAISISHKRREIGILRAVGARSSDVFKIFFCEAAIIALINYVLSMVATVIASEVVNSLVREEGINVTLLHFGVRQVILMLAISLFVAAAASFLPVYKVARRKPVDAIKNK